MAFVRESDIRVRAKRRADSEGITAEEILERVIRRRLAAYDIFLSQTTRDAEIVLGVYDLLTSAGYTVFCDWISAPQADRSQVTPANAEFVRSMMRVSSSLLFLDTDGAAQSLWMCWELGWFDGHRGPVAVLPILPDGQHHYRGREFLGLYPYVEIDGEGRLKVVRPVVASPSGISIIESPNDRAFDSWRHDPRDGMRPRVAGGLGR